MEKAMQNKYIEQACEFLCTIDDPLVCYNFPHKNNCCKKVKKVSSVKLDHQQGFCLSGKHETCKIYQQEKPKYLPRGILYSTSNYKKRAILILGFIGLFFLIMLGLTQSYGNGIDEAPSVLNRVVRNSDTPRVTISLAPSSTLQDSLPTKITLTNPDLGPESQLPQHQPNVTSTNAPGFSTPFGVNQIYVIHKIKRGESLRYIADLYGVPVDSLHGINSLLEGYPIWVDQIIIVQLGVTAGPYEKLDAIQILEDTPLELIATQYFTTIEKLIELNNLGDSEIIPAGRWLIVPHY